MLDINNRIEKIQSFDFAEPRQCEDYENTSNVVSLHTSNTIKWEYTGRFFHKKVSRFPTIIKADGSPWFDGSLFMLSLYEGVRLNKESSVARIARDILYFFRWSLDADIDYLDCSTEINAKLPTYQYARYLSREVEANRLAISTAKRRLHSSLRFYTWLKDNELIEDKDLWIETELWGISSTGNFSLAQTIVTTNLSKSLRNVRAKTPTHETIKDGRELHPLTPEETCALRECLVNIGNTEMSLAFDIALMTGARIGTVFTLRNCSTPDNHEAGFAKVHTGGGGLVRSKYDRETILYIPDVNGGVKVVHCSGGICRRGRCKSRPV